MSTETEAEPQQPEPQQTEPTQAQPSRTWASRAGARSAAPPGTRGSFVSGPTIKVVILGLILLGLLVPTFMVEGLVREREVRAERVVAEIGEQSGGAQTVTGPLLMVPALRREAVAQSASDREPRTRTVRDIVVIRPHVLNARIDAETETLSRSIYDARVYRATAELEARFAPFDDDVLGADIVSLDWSEAFVAVGVTDPAAIDTASLSWNGRAMAEIEPGLGVHATQDEPGFHTLALGLAGPPTADVPVSVALALRGSQRMAIAPAGLETAASIAANWPHPSFGGRLADVRSPDSGAYDYDLGTLRLPGEREITEQGFSARWSVSRLSLQLGRAWTVGQSGAIRPLLSSLVGVSLVEPVDHYARVRRVVSYGALVLIGVLSATFLLEVFAPRTLALVQYLMVGSMIVVFYVLLLALSEHMGFALAYTIAAGASGGVLAGFVGSVIGGRRWSLIAGAAFLGIYAALYAVLGLEDFALLAGAVFTFVLLTTVMFATRSIDWSGAGRTFGAAQGR